MTRSYALAALAMGGILALAGCSGEDPEPGGTAASTTTSAPTTAATTAATPAATPEPVTASGTCPTVPQEGFGLFSTDLVATAPEEGQVYGGVDHPVAWTFSEALESTPSVDLYYVNEAGDAIAMGGLFLEDQGGNTWGTSNDVFWTEADGRPGFAILTVTNDAGMDDDGNLTADVETVGVYCLTYQATA